MKMEFIDVNDVREMADVNSRQQRALSVLPDLEQFCKTNKLSLDDLEILVDVLRHKRNGSPLS